MAERGDSFSDDSSSSEPDIRKSRIDSVTVSAVSERPDWSMPPCHDSESHSPIPAWRRNIDINSPPPPQPSPPPFKLTSVVTTLFNKIKSHKVEPTRISPIDARCDEDHVPIVYNKQYDIQGAKSIGLPRQTLLYDKPARVFSAIKSIAITKVTVAS